MKYFIDTEFLEGPQKKKFFGITYGETKPTIDLISIGIVAEDGREYYAVSKDFNLDEAWNRWQPGEGQFINAGMSKIYPKAYWLRDNVLKPIWKELAYKEYREDPNEIKEEFYQILDRIPIAKQADFYTNEMQERNNFPVLFEYSELKRLLKKYGKTNAQIAEEIFQFCTNDSLSIEKAKYYNVVKEGIEFYGYYCDYDWVVFCWMFGKMIDLPKGFPMYCRDLKQMLDEKAGSLNWLDGRDCWSNANRSIYTIGKGKHQIDDKPATIEQKLKTIKELQEYPKQTNEHNAHADARWHFELYKFLQTP